MTILCIIGPSGSGKTTLAEALVPTGIDTIRSYTTRPMRPGEKQGREHIFIDEHEARRLLSTQRPLAYTLFGDYYRYFALWSQIDPISSPFNDDRGGIISYVIDEAGYLDLENAIFDLRDSMYTDYTIWVPPITILPIRIERSEDDIAATIDPDRRSRDAGREAYNNDITYRIVIRNDAPTAADLTAWAQHQLSPALRIWLSSNIESQHPVSIPTTLTTSMRTAHIIAHLNGAI